MSGRALSSRLPNIFYGALGSPRLQRPLVGLPAGDPFGWSSRLPPPWSSSPSRPSPSSSSLSARWWGSRPRPGTTAWAAAWVTRWRGADGAAANPDAVMFSVDMSNIGMLCEVFSCILLCICVLGYVLLQWYIKRIVAELIEE